MTRAAITGGIRSGLRSEGDEIKFASTATDYSMLPDEIKVGQVRSCCLFFRTWIFFV